MYIKRLKLPILIIAIGLAVSIVACMLVGIMKKPTVTEYDFDYSVTYKLNGETKTLKGVYRCKFVGHGGISDPLDRYYEGSFVDQTPGEDFGDFIIAEEDDLKLCIVFILSDAYIMGDAEEDDYNYDPYLAVYNREGGEYPIEELGSFDAEIIDWEYGAPADNTFVFAGFSTLHSASMVAMIFVGVLTIIACFVFVKKEESISYKKLDRLSVIFNFIVGFAAIPFLSLIVSMLPIAGSISAFIYGVFICIPGLTAFTIAASVALRRRGFTYTGFFVQFVAPAIFLLYIFLESLINNVFS